MILTWIHPCKCIPPHRITHWDKFTDLKNNLSNGWDSACPVLIGYLFENKIQLISGSHRWAAMLELNKEIPVFVMDYEVVLSIHGTDTWVNMMSNPPLLENFDGN